MSDSFEPAEGWVEISDADGHKEQLQHLATIHDGEKTYFVLGTPPTEEERGRLMLVRQDRAGDGAEEYVACYDENEIERVVGQFMMNAIAEDLLFEAEDEAVCGDCGMLHDVLDVCVCGHPELLQ